MKKLLAIVCIPFAAGCTTFDLASILLTTQEQAATTTQAAHALEGYVYSRTYRVDGVVREAGAITWVDAWTRTGSADKDDISVSQPTISETQQDDAFAPVPSDVDSALDEIAAALESEKKKAKK